jgi:hypothetical protein
VSSDTPGKSPTRTCSPVMRIVFPLSLDDPQIGRSRPICTRGAPVPPHRIRPADRTGRILVKDMRPVRTHLCRASDSTESSTVPSSTQRVAAFSVVGQVQKATGHRVIAITRTPVSKDFAVQSIVPKLIPSWMSRHDCPGLRGERQDRLSASPRTPSIGCCAIRFPQPCTSRSHKRSGWTPPSS